jgi:hypothetical protein
MTAQPPAGRTPSFLDEDDEHGIVTWVRALVQGVKDSFRDVIDEGRRGTNEAYEEGWRRFERKTRHRRDSPPARSRRK